MTDYSSTKEAEAKVTVAGTPIPIVNHGLTTEIRKQGPLALNRHSEVNYPANAFGTDWNDLLGVYGDSDNVISDTVDVFVREEGDGNFILVHRGYARGFGGNGNLNGMRLDIGSVSDFMGVVPAEAHFSSDATGKDVIEYILDTLEEGQPVFNDISLATPSNVRLNTQVLYREENALDLDTLFYFGTGGPIGSLVSGKTFRPNRHTLKDVWDWISKDLGLRGFFEPRRESGLAFVVVKEDEWPYSTHRQRSLGGETALLANNALHSISPMNRLTLVGQAIQDSNYDENALQTATVPGSKYPRVTVQYDPLVERAGQPIAATEEVDTSTLGATENAAKKRLKKRLDGAEGGMIRSRLEPTLSPFDKLVAQPTVSGDAVEDVSPFSYEVESVRHRAVADPESTSDGLGSRTDLRVSLFVDPEKISVVDDETGIIEV